MKTDNLIMINKQEKSKWMDGRMAKGYSFHYIKGIFEGKQINVAVVCDETDETFAFNWEEQSNEEYI